MLLNLQNCFIEPIIAPIVQIPRVTTTTVGVRWGVINVQVDAWTANIRRKANFSSTDPDLIFPPLQVIFVFFFFFFMINLLAIWQL